MVNSWKTMNDEEIREKCIELGKSYMNDVRNKTNDATAIRIEKALKDTSDIRFSNKARKIQFGVNEFGKYSKLNNKLEYEKWTDMLRRVFCPEYKKKNPTYKDCTMSEVFNNFQNFCDWLTNQIGYNKNFELDKDLLYKNNKHYSENNCVLLPSEINKALPKSNIKKRIYPVGVRKASRNSSKFEAFICIKGKDVYLGRFVTPEEAFQAYKVAKEAHLKELAEKWKTEIDPRAYEALLNYQVEIDD